MSPQTVTIDSSGHLTLPQPALDALGIEGDKVTEVVLELTGAGVVIKPKGALSPITARIAAMNLPVADWEQMEREIEEGR